MTTARNVRRAVLALTLAAVALLPAWAARAQDALLDPSKLATPPLRHVQVPRPERYVMPNGIVVFLLPDHDLPRVTGTAYFKASPLWIPDDKVGLGGLTGDVMRSGGSSAHSGDWLDDRLAAIGASISTGVQADLGNGGFRCLTENAAEVIGLFAEVLRAPAFPEDKIELSKVGLRQAIASRNDEMVSVLVRVSTEAVFGKDHPYARKPEYATVEAIGAADCRTLHARVFRPDRMVLAVYGDFQPAAMKKLLLARFGDWKKGDATPVPAPPAVKPAAPRLVFAPKEDVTQSGIILAQIGFRADDPDYAAMNVFGMALGGGFQSRLVNKIRTERGLAYASGCNVGADYIRPGVFLAYSLTRTDSALTALDLLRGETARAIQEPFTEGELQAAKSSVLNGLIFEFADPSAVLFRSAYYELAGYPLDFLERYQKSLEGVDAAQVLAAGQRKVHPDQAVAIIVGKEKEFEKPLESMGLAVERVDISIPPPASKLANVGAASPQALQEGQALLQKAADFAGGSKAWAAIKSVSLAQEGTLTMQGQSMAITMTMDWRLPDHFVQHMKMAMGEVVQGFDGTNGWMAFGPNVQDQPKIAEEAKKDFERSLFRLFGAPGDFQVQLLPEPRTVAGVACKVALVKSELVQDWLLFFAPDGSLRGTEYQGQGMAGPAKMTTLYDDWGPVGVIKYPRAEKTLADDQPVMEGKITSVKVDPPLADDIFKKPASQ